MAKKGNRSFFDWCRSWTPEQIMTLFTAVLTVCAIGSWVVSYLQWDAARKQLDFATTSAADSAKDTQRALANSDVVAQAATAQADALKVQAGLFESELGVLSKQAGALRQSVEVSRAQLSTSAAILRVDRAGHLALAAGSLEGFYAEYSQPKLTFRIKNVGNTTLHSTKIYGAIAMLGFAQSERLWQSARIYKTVTIPPQGEELLPLTMDRRLDEQERGNVLAGSNDIVAVLKVEFRNDGEKDEHSRYLCYRFSHSDEGGMTEGSCPHPDEL